MFQLIVWFTEQLAPRNANVLFFSKKMGECGGCNLREPWYQVQYEVEGRLWQSQLIGSPIYFQNSGYTLMDQSVWYLEAT